VVLRRRLGRSGYHRHATRPTGRSTDADAPDRSSSLTFTATHADAVNSLDAATVAGAATSDAPVNPPVSGEPIKQAQVTPAAAAVKHALFEPTALLLLSLATVGTAWCSFQAATWSGVSQRTMNLSAASSRRAAVQDLQSYQLQLVDVLLFSQYLNARAATNETLARFYADRFRGEAKTAFEAWMATHPFENPNAPAHPFVTNLYQPRLRLEAGLAEAESQRLWQQAGEAGRSSRSYVFITVLLASVLFCGGTAAKFDAAWIRRTVLALGLGAFIFAAARLWMLPIQL
jgi:hypothetical protein